MRIRQASLIGLLSSILMIMLPLRTSASTQVAFKLLLEITPPQNNLSVVAWVSWSPDGKKLAVIYENDRVIRILNSANGKLLFSIAIPNMITWGERIHLAWSPSGKFLAASFDIPTPKISIWEIKDETATPLTSIMRSGSDSDMLQWYPDESKLIEALFLLDKEQWEIFVWDRATGSVIYNETKTRIAQLSPDGKRFIDWGTLNNESKLRVVDSATFRTIAWLPDSIVPDLNLILGFVSWQKNNRLVVGFSCSSPATMNCVPWLWDTRTNKIVKVFNDIRLFPHWAENALGFSPSGKLLAVVDYRVNLLDLDSGTLTNLPENMRQGIISWHPYDDVLAVGSADGYIQIWQISVKTDESGTF
jgi:WD40 repeat protein